MKTNTQKFNWILDALLFTGFLITFVMDWTGLSLHQWIGVFGGLLAVLHLIMHWDWVMAVSARFFGKTSGQARAYFLLDMALMLSLYLIVMSGLVISTWLNLALTNYSAWAAFHEIASYVTLALVVLKIGLHWRWIVRVARQHIFAPTPQPAPQLRPLPAAPVAATVNRRDFLKLMGIVGMASLFAFTSALNDNDETQSASAAAANLSASQSGQAATGSASAAETVNSVAASPTAIPTAASESASVAAAVPTIVPTATTTTVTTSCTIRCNKNKHCSYPGDCRRYQDSSGNGRCDLGECA